MPGARGERFLGLRGGREQPVMPARALEPRSPRLPTHRAPRGVPRVCWCVVGPHKRHSTDHRHNM